MKSLMFVQTNNGKIYYKCDSFWSASTKIENAKIYSDDNQSSIDEWLTSYEYNIEKYLERHPDKLKDITDEYHGCKLGYRTIEDKFLKNQFVANEGTKDEDLGPIIYTHEMQINGINRPKIYDIRKRYIREEKIAQILK